MTNNVQSTDQRRSHTPGPWTQYCHGNQVYGGDQFFITAVQSKNPEADARLIAAAPELLAACKELLAHSNANLCECGKPDCATTRMRAAVHKATGEHV